MEKKQKIQEERVIHIKEDDLTKLKEHSKKLKELENYVKKVDTQIRDVRDRYLRTAAEFDNYKKRTEREKQEIFKFGIEGLVMQLLPFDDIFEGVIKQMENNPAPEVIHKGLEMLKREFTKFLCSIGVKRIETAGNKFNTEFHEASGILETNEYENGTIIEEDRSGYLLNGRVLRPALVKVAKAPEIKKTSHEDSVSGKD